MLDTFHISKEVSSMLDVARAQFRADPEYKALDIEALVTAFKALPAPISQYDIDGAIWVINLQYPTSKLTTKDEENMEIAIWRQEMMDQAVFPCKRSLLARRDGLPYLLSIILRACTVEAHKMLEQDMSNFEPNPVNLDFSSSTPVLNLDKGAAPSLTTPGLMPLPAHILMRKKAPANLPKNLRMYRPAHLRFRDYGIISSLTMHLFVFGLHTVDVSPHNSPGTGFIGKSGKFRKDVTFCGLKSCTSLSKSHSKCSRCEITYYCSVEHQKAHWQRHKDMCNKTQKLFAEEAAEGLAVKPMMMDMANVKISGRKG